MTPPAASGSRAPRSRPSGSRRGRRRDRRPRRRPRRRPPAAALSSARRSPADYRTAIAAPLYFRHEVIGRHDTGPHPEGPGRIPAIEVYRQRRDWLGFERREAPAVSMDVLGAVYTFAYEDNKQTM